PPVTPPAKPGRWRRVDDRGRAAYGSACPTAALQNGDSALATESHAPTRPPRRLRRRGCHTLEVLGTSRSRSATETQSPTRPPARPAPRSVQPATDARPDPMAAARKINRTPSYLPASKPPSYRPPRPHHAPHWSGPLA